MRALRVYFRRYVWFLVILLFLAVQFSPSLQHWWQYRRFQQKPSYNLLLLKTPFLAVNFLGPISDITLTGAPRRVWVAGNVGAASTDFTGKVLTRVSFPTFYPDLSILPDMQGGGVKLFSAAPYTDSVALLDQAGSVIWRIQAFEEHPSATRLLDKNLPPYHSTDSMLFHASPYGVGDLYGDGKREFVISRSAGEEDNLCVYNEQGQQLWQRHEAGIGLQSFAIVDINHDGNGEIISCEGSYSIFSSIYQEHLIVRDNLGRKLHSIHLPVLFEDFMARSIYSFVPWPEADSAPLLLILDKDIIRVLGFDGKPRAQYAVPNGIVAFPYQARLSGTPVQLAPGEPPYFAALLSNEFADLIIYDARGAVVYQEHLPYGASSLRAIPSRENPRAQDLLVGGGDGVVLRYCYAGKLVK